MIDFRYLIFQLLSNAYFSSFNMAASKAEKAVTKHTTRIIDITSEPLVSLAPICGYEKMPLVTLEEAVEPLVSILPAVQSHADYAKERCEEPADKLTPDESASIMLYTMDWSPSYECLYVVLNETLRSTSPDRQQKLKPWYLYLRLFLNALFRLPPVHATVYRGVKLDLSQKYIEKDKKYVWWSFSSSTTSVGVLQTDLFLGNKGARTMFSIQCESARDIRKHSDLPHEDEVLLMAATQFEVISCLNQGDLHIIQLKETRPSHPLLQPVPVVGPTPMPIVIPQPGYQSNKLGNNNNNDK
jgi:hypothetical protein